MTAEQIEVKAKVRSILELMTEKWRWAAFDPTHQIWLVFRREPKIERYGGKGQVYEWWDRTMFDSTLFGFNLPSFPGDWKDSPVYRDSQ